MGQNDLDPEDPDYCPGELAFDDIHTSDYRKRGWVCVWCWNEPPENT